MISYFCIVLLSRKGRASAVKKAEQHVCNAKFSPFPHGRGGGKREEEEGDISSLFAS